MATVTLVDPIDISARTLSGFRMATRQKDTDHRRLTLIDNGKPKARELLVMVAQNLALQWLDCEVSVHEKASASSVLSAQAISDIVDSADLVIAGLGDCGACSACSLNDVLLLEQAGIPATVIISDAFTSHIAALSANLGAPAYPIAVVPHPVSSKNDEQLAQYAAAITAMVAKQLTESSSDSAAASARSA